MANSYKVWVKDANGCVKQTNVVTITQPTDVSFSIASQTNISCFGGNTGSIVLQASGGTPTYQYAINAGGFQTSTTFASLTAAVYSFTVKDLNGCTKTTSATISQPSDIVSTASMIQGVSCFGGSNGVLQGSGSGGISPYQYSLSNGNYVSSSSFASLPIGSYQIWVKDANGCVKSSSSIGITQPTAVAITPTVSNVKCNAGSDGSALLTASGGVGNYTYALGNNAYQSSNNFGGMTAGSYSFSAKDANGCVKTINLSVSEPTAIVPTLIVNQNVSCFGGNNAAIQVAATGGTPNYTYSIDNTTFGASAVFNNLSANNYQVWVKDANGCIKPTNTVNVTQPTAVTLSVASKTDVKCFGGNDGSIQVAATGGVGAYTYANGAGAFQASPSFATLAANSYTFQVKDGNGCLKTVSTTISQPAVLRVIATTTQNVSCFGGNNGSIQTVALGGVAPYQYSLGGLDFVTTSTFSALGGGIYQIVVKDANACVMTSATTLVSQPMPITATSTSASARCFGGSDGAVQLAASGGVSPYTFQKSADLYQASNTFSGLTSGAYTFNVKDANGCIKTVSATVSQPTDLVTSTTVIKNILCFGGNVGEIKVTASGATPAYQYSINGVNYQSSATFSGLSAANYQTWTKDANGCVKQSAIVNITQPTVLQASVASLSAVKCYGGSDGTITVSAIGGVSPYTYLMQGRSSQTTASFGALSANTYQFTITDQNGCIKNLTATITQPQQSLQASIITKTNSTCFQTPTGQILGGAIGGTDPYRYSLSDNNFQATGLFAGLYASTYVLSVKDANDCASTTTFSISQPTDITITLLQKKDVDCEYYKRGEFKVGATGGTGTFTYTLTGTDFKNNAITNITNTTGAFSNLLAGNYVVNARDQAGCVKPFPVSIVPKSSAIRYEIVKNPPTICTNADGRIQITNVVGGNPPYQYNISGQTIFSSNNTFANLASGIYFVTVADSLCAYKQEVDISLASTIKAAINITPISCNVPNGNVSVVNVTGGNGNYSYALNNGSFSSNNSFTNLTPNTYTITIQDSPLSCKSVISFEIKEQNKSDLQLVSKQNISCFNGKDGIIKVQGGNAVAAPFVYAINSGTFGSGDTFTGLSIGSYQILARNQFGCIDSLRVVLIQPTELKLINSKKDNDCNGDATGRIDLVGVGGTLPYRYSIDSTNYQPTGTFANLKAQNYTVTVKDNNGCIAKTTSQLTQPTLIGVAPVYRDTIKCYGEANGLVLVNASGGVPGYQYSRDSINYFVNNTFNNLTAGTYTFYVKDAKQCIQQKKLIVSSPTKLDLGLVSKTDPLCNQAQNGSIEVKATGGNGGYTYEVNGAITQTVGLFTGLTEANYNFTVTDRKGCVANFNNTALKWPQTLVLDTKTTLPLCFGQANGSIAVTIQGGTIPYQTNTIGTVSNPTNNSFIYSNLLATTHTIRITDKNGCVLSQPILLTQPDSLKVRSTVKNNDCFGDATGGLELMGTGGVAPYKFSIDGAAFQTSGIFTALNANTYLAYVKDDKGCITAQKTPIVQPALIKVTPVYADTIRCTGDANGKIVVLATGGTPAYQYSKDGSLYFADSAFAKLTTANYTFYVKDSKGCVQKNTLTVTEPSFLRLNLITKTDPLCNKDQNGVIQIAAGGSNGGYLYQITGGSNQASGTFTGLTERQYDFTVTDRRGCVQTLTGTTLKWPEALVWTAQTTLPLCFGDANGSILMTAKGGTMPYQANLENNIQTGTSGAFTFTNVAAKTHTIALTDAQGCKNIQNLTLQQPDKLGAKITPKNNDCFGDATGQIELTATGGTADYQYALDNGVFQNLGLFSTLKTNNYTVRVKDKNGCLFNQIVPIIQPSLITLSPIYADTVRCFGEANGAVKINAGGGTPNIGVSPYTYSIDGVNYQTDATLKNLKAGAYTFYVKDSKQCVQKNELNITEPTPMRMTVVSQTNPLCAGEQNGSIKVAATGGNGAYTYILDNVLKQPNNGTFGGLTEAQYALRATDWKGCAASTPTVQLNWPKPLTSSVSITQPRCFGENNGQISVNVTGGMAPYMVQLGAEKQNISNNAQFQNLSAQTYEILLRDQNGCQLQIPAKLAMPSLFNPIKMADTNAVCKDQIVVLNANNPDKTAIWYYNGREISRQQEISVKDAGQYSVEITNTTGCVVKGNYTLKNSNKALNADFLMAVQAFVGDTVYALNTSNPTPDLVRWTFPSSVYSIEKNNQRGAFVAPQIGKYLIAMTASKGECMSTKEREIEIFERKSISQTNPSLGYQEANLFESVIVHPNPNYGRFKIDIKFSHVSDVNVTISRSTNAAIVYNSSKSGQSTYLFDLDLKNFTQDIYVVIVRAGTTAVTRKILLMN